MSLGNKSSGLALHGRNARQSRPPIPHTPGPRRHCQWVTMWLWHCCGRLTHSDCFGMNT